MPRLELLMTDTKLTLDDARALLSDHIEGALDVDTRGAVDALLAGDTALAAEHRRLKQTLELLRTLPQPEPPSDVVGKVRDRLTAERRALAAGSSRTGAFGDDDNVITPPARTWRRFIGVEAAIGLAAVAGIAVFIGVAGTGAATGGPHGTQGAGITAAEGAVPATIVVPGIPHAVLVELAGKAGMDTLTSADSSHAGSAVFEGDRRAAGRFLIALKGAAASRGVEVSGFVPDAERVRIEVRAK